MVVIILIQKGKKKVLIERNIAMNQKRELVKIQFK